MKQILVEYYVLVVKMLLKNVIMLSYDLSLVELKHAELDSFC